MLINLYILTVRCQTLIWPQPVRPPSLASHITWDRALEFLVQLCRTFNWNWRIGNKLLNTDVVMRTKLDYAWPVLSGGPTYLQYLKGAMQFYVTCITVISHPFKYHWRPVMGAHGQGLDHFASKTAGCPLNGAHGVRIMVCTSRWKHIN